MVEETGTGQSEQENLEPVNQNQSQEEPGEKVGALAALSNFIPQKTAEKLSEVVNAKTAKPAQEKPAQQKNETGDKPAETEKKTDAKKNEGDGKVEDSDEDDDSPSVLGIKNPKKQTNSTLAIEKPEDILNVIKKDFGQEYKDIKEVSKFFESTQKWRKDSQELSKVKTDFENITSILDNTPRELLEAIKLYHTGEDYMKAFKDLPTLNFDIPVEKQDIEKLVNNYFPGKFTPDDFKEETISPALEIAISASKDKYNLMKATRDNERAMYEKNAAQRLESVKNSVTGSVNYLKQSFPDAKQEVTKEISSTLEGGIQKVAELFFNGDGTVKPEAAEMLMMAKHGKSEINRMMKIAANQAESRANEEIATRGADTAKPTRTGSQGVEQISDDVKQLISGLSKLKTKPTY